MISHLSEETCCNPHCQQKLANGNNTGGFKATQTREGNWQTGYTCKKCSNQSTPSTKQLREFQHTQHYYHNTTNNEIEHKRAWQHEQAWQKLLDNLGEDDERNSHAPKMPTWKQVIKRMKKNEKKEAKA